MDTQQKRPAIDVYFDPSGRAGGRGGCYRARLRDNPGVKDACMTPDMVVRKLLITAKTFGFSGEHADYDVDILSRRP